MSTALSAFYPLLLTELPGCPQPMVDMHLREIARQFCQRSRAWRLPFDAVDLVSGQATYDLSSPESGAEVVCITELTLADELLWRDSDADDPSCTAEEPKYDRNAPPFSVSNGIDQITLTADEVPSADFVGGLVMTGALKPTAAATSLPDFLMNQYSESMRVGTLGRLMAMGNQSWTDRPMAVAYMGMFESRLHFAGNQARVGNTRQALRVKKWG